MYTLQIQHPITDYPTWKNAFDQFADMRRGAGVLAHRVARPHDDAAYVVVELDFATSAGAEGFLEFLRTNVWAKPQNSPGLAGAPVTRILAVDEVS